MTARLETRDLVKRFGGLVATDHVSIRVEPGEIRGLIGPNGAGKTTLLNLVTGLYAPSSGDIRLDGESLVGLAPHQVARRGLARSFQVSRLFGNMTVFENLLVSWLAGRPARRVDVEEGRRRARGFLDLTGLARLADAPAKGLSGGQRALLQAACGFMAPELKFYVLDEPFAGINPVVKDAIVDLVLDANARRGVTFLVVSHEMAVMRRLCRRVSVVMQGRVVGEGTLDEVAARDDVVSGYLGRSRA